MAIQVKKRYTTEEFDQFVMLPENADRHFEFFAGEVVEVVSNNYSSEIAMLIGAMLVLFVKKERLGHVTGADGGYVVAGQRFIPDVAFISAARQPQPSREAYNPNPPNLAVEVLSPSDDPANMRIKVASYLKAGTVLWVVDPDKKQVEIYAPDQLPKTANLDGTLDGGDILPGFALPVKDIFPEEQE